LLLGLTFWSAQYIIYLWSAKSEVMKLSPRTGRPKAENPKNISIKIRFDEETNESLMKYCEKNKISRTDAIRKGLKMLLSEEK
jgi:hypothetical protein